MKIGTSIVLAVTPVLMGYQSEKAGKAVSAHPHAQAGTQSGIKETQPESAEENNEWEKVDAYCAHRKVSPALIQTVVPPCAIVVYPSKQQLRMQEKEVGEEDSQTINDDMANFMSNAIEILDRLKVKTVVAKRRFLRIKGQEDVLLDIRKDGAPSSNLILCAASKAPVMRVPIDVDQEFVENYFELAQHQAKVNSR